MRKVSQVTLFQALRKWTNFDSQNRKHLVGRAIECVEFRSMSVQALSAEVESSDLMSIASCRKMLFDAYKYHALIQSKTSLTSESSPCTNPPSNVEVSSSPDKMVSSSVVERVHRPQGSPQILKAVSPIRKSEKSFCKVKQTRNVKQGKLLAICGTHIFELMESGIKMEWIQITKIPRSRSYPAIAYFDGCLFVIGGQDSETKKVTNKVWKYNLLTSQWEDGIPLQEARDYAAAAIIGNTFYVVGGMSNDPKMKRNMVHSMEIYTSHKKGWNYAAPASASTIGATVVSSGKFLYRIGGYDGTTTLQHLEVYDPKKDRWYMKAPMITNLGYASGALVNDDFYLLGGVYVQHRQGHQAIIHMNNIFRLHDSRWIHVSRAGTPRYNSGVIVLNKRIYLLGGYQTKDDAKLTSVECFDTELKVFVESDIPSLPKGGAVVCCVVPRDPAP